MELQGVGQADVHAVFFTIQVDLPAASSEDGGPLAALFAEELGLVLEVAQADEERVLSTYAAAGVPCTVVGTSQADQAVSISVNGSQQIQGLQQASLAQQLTLLRF